MCCILRYLLYLQWRWRCCNVRSQKRRGGNGAASVGSIRSLAVAAHSVKVQANLRLKEIMGSLTQKEGKKEGRANESSILGIRCQQQQLVDWTCRSNQIFPATDLASFFKLQFFLSNCAPPRPRARSRPPRVGPGRRNLVGRRSQRPVRPRESAGGPGGKNIGIGLPGKLILC